MKKFLSLLLSAVVIFSITAGIDLSAYADEYKYTKDGFEYCTGYTNDVHIYGYSGTAKDIVIPSKIDGKTVTLARIYDCDTIETIYVPKTINDFQGSVIPIPFKGCNNLREINVEKGNKKFYSKDGVMYYTNRNVDYSDYGEDIPIVNKIMKYPAGKTEKEFTIPNGTDGVYQEAFCNSKKLKRVNFPDNIKMIDYRSFANCTGLTAITLPKNIESLAYYSFVGCSSLTSVGIPKSLKTIGMDAFSGCDKIKDVYYEGSKADWKNIDISDWGNESLLNATIHYNAEIDCLAGHSSIEKSVKTTKATTKKNGTVTELCNICGKKIKSTTIYYPKTITLSKTSYVYDGKVKKPTVTVKDSKGNKISSKYYTVTYSSGRKAVGTYTVTIKFKGNYSGTVKKTFTIKPKSTSISKLTAKSKGFTVKWKKLTTQTTGYQIQYSTSSKFTSKTTKTVTVSKNKTTSKTISKLKAKKKYYVRVRTYKIVSGKKIYSAWSKAKTVTTKK